MDGSRSLFFSSVLSSFYFFFSLLLCVLYVIKRNSYFSCLWVYKVIPMTFNSSLVDYNRTRISKPKLSDLVFVLLILLIDDWLLSVNTDSYPHPQSSILNNNALREINQSSLEQFYMYEKKPTGGFWTIIKSIFFVRRQIYLE